MTPGALAARERVQPPSMTRVIASLAELGLVERSAHPTDGRQVVVSLSEAGADIVQADRSAREEWLREHLADFTLTNARYCGRQPTCCRRWSTKTVS